MAWNYFLPIYQLESSPCEKIKHKFGSLYTRTCLFEGKFMHPMCLAFYKILRNIERGINGYEKLYYTILIDDANQILNFWINNFL